jgi:hypothetical protein
MTIHTPTTRNAVRQRLNRRLQARASAELVLQKMQQGEALHRLHARRWELTSGTIVDYRVAEAVLGFSNIAGVGDALFDDVPCQTYRYCK